MGGRGHYIIRNWCVVTIIFLAAVSGIPLHGKVTREAENQFARAVIDYLSSGDVAEAKSAFSELAQAYPDYADPLFNLGLLASADGNRSEAIDYFQRFLDLAPGHEKAVEASGRLMALKVTDEERFAMLLAEANESLEKGNTSEAFSYASEAHSIEPDRWEAPILAAKALIVEESWDEALTFVEKGIELSSDNIEVQMELKTLRHNLSGRLEIQTALDEAAGLESEENYLEAAVAYEKAAKLLPNGPTYHLAGLNYLMVDRWEEAKKAFEQAIDLGDETVAEEAREQLRYVERQIGIKAADALPEHVIDMPGVASFEQGLKALYFGDTEQALTAFEVAIAQVPVNPMYARYFMMRGTALLELGETKAALEDFNRAAIIEPNTKGLYWVRALAYEKLNRYDDAESDYRTILRNGDDAEAKVSIARLMLRQKRYREAGNEVERIVRGDSYHRKKEASQVWAAAGRGLDDKSMEMEGLAWLSREGLASESEEKRLLKLRSSWVLVMTPDMRGQDQGYDDFEGNPLASFERLWNRGSWVTNYTYDAYFDRWEIVDTRDRVYKDQIASYEEKFPRDWIQEGWKTGYRITGVERSRSHWLVLMSSFDYQGGETYFFADKNELKAKLDESSARGMRIQNVVYEGPDWFVVTNTKSKFGEEVWNLADSFPTEWIRRRQLENYYIKNLEYGGGQWFVAMGKGPKKGEWDKRQYYLNDAAFPTGHIQSDWREGYRITELNAVVEDIPEL